MKVEHLLSVRTIGNPGRIELIPGFEYCLHYGIERSHSFNDAARNRAAARSRSGRMCKGFNDLALGKWRSVGDVPRLTPGAFICSDSDHGLHYIGHVAEAAWDF